jgi:hypothetical protein
LRRQDFGEADRVVTLYSPRLGKFRAIAKGVRRPKSRLGGNVELFTHVNVLVAQGRNLDVITQAEAVRTYRHLRDDLWKAAYACYAAELGPVHRGCRRTACVQCAAQPELLTSRSARWPRPMARNRRRRQVSGCAT